MAIVKKIWTMNAGEDMGKEELLFIAGRNAKLSSHYGNSAWMGLKNGNQNDHIPKLFGLIP